jgi:hypothetical protein
MHEREPKLPIPPSPETTGQVIPFEPRRAPDRPQSLGHHSIPPAPPPRNAADDGEDSRGEFRHRMKTNLATLAVVALLIWCGLWLADTIATLRKTQDCVLSGRRNCAPIALPEHER